MRRHRLLSALTAAALSLSLVTAVPAPGKAAALSSFSDLGGMPQVARAAEMLRVLGVVNGLPGGAYHPENTLSRAEFCAMAIRAMGREEDEPAQRSRTIYLDVGPGFWATGYINLASTITLGGTDSSPGTALVAGVGDGTFQPWRAITYGEAVAILCRMLGYGTSNVGAGSAWYEGYLAVAASAGLTEELSIAGDAVIDRGQAAILFYNLYFSKPKGSDKTYLAAQGGSEEQGHILLDVNAVADDGTTGAIKTTKSIYKTDRVLDSTLVGQEGSVLLDKDGELLDFKPKEGISRRLVNITSTNATYLTNAEGEKVRLEPDTKLYKEGKETTWKDAYLDVGEMAPVPVTFHYGANGKLSYLFLSGSAEEAVTSMVVRANPNGVLNPFASMAQGGGYTMFKNGASATAADLRQYDTATWDETTRVIQVCDVKLTGIYEDAIPSPAAPITIRVLGIEFPVLDSARSDLERFKVGSSITLLLTHDNKVAGVVDSSVVRGDAVGVASVKDESATVKLLQGGLEVKGRVSEGAGRFNDQLVVVSSGTRERLTLTGASGSAARGDLDVSARRLGEKVVANNVAVYDRVRNGAAVAVSYDTLPSVVSRSKIAYVSYDYAGRVRTIVLDDVTGDAYSYGYFYYERTREDPDDPTKNIDADSICVRQAGENGADAYSERARYSGGVRQGKPGGLALTVSGEVAALVDLTAVKNVKTSAFDCEEMTLTVGGVAYPVSDKVQSYNKTTKTWFAMGQEGLKAVRAYADEVTVYYDRDPGKGGKIRMIEVG